MGGPPGDPAPRPRDEARHPDAVAERWTFVAGPEGERSIVVHLTAVPGDASAALALVVRVEPEVAVVLVASDLRLPPRGLELRGPGLWCDHNVEEPLVRWSLGLEAFGVGIDVAPEADPEVVLATRGAPDLRGDRTPLGWDLEWTSTAPPVPDPGGAAGYTVACRVEGELLVGSAVLELDGPGERSHRW